MNLPDTSWITFSIVMLVAFLPTCILNQNLPPPTHPVSIASRLMSQANSHGASLPDQDAVLNIQQGLIRLSLPEVQQAVLQSLQDISRREGAGGEALGAAEMGVGEEGGTQAKQNITSELCLNHTVAVVVGLLSKQKWAVQMLDAMGKPGPGVTQGNIIWPGAYKQCLNVRANTSFPMPSSFSGQYCLAIVTLAPPSPTNTLGTNIVLGICAPDTCSDLDLTLLFQDVLHTVLNMTQKAAVTCSPQNVALDTKAIIAIVICSLFLFLIIMGTALDVIYIQMPKWQTVDKLYTSASGYTSIEENTPLLFSPDVAERRPEPGLCIKMCMAFSVYTNGAKLLSTRKVAGSLDCIHGVRFLSMTWVVLGHVFALPIMGSANALPYFNEVLKRWSFQGIGNAVVSVDSFFALSGLLVAYLSLKEMKRRSGKINWFMFYFHRFWRLTPVYMLVIMIYVCLQPYMGEGPLWTSVNADRDNCKTSWWANLLYINNLVKTKEMCLAQSWYLANDMQFYILSPLIFVPFYFSPWLGAVSSAVFLLITAIVPGALTMRDHYPPSMLPGQLQGNNTDTQDYMVDFYMKPYNRMGPYIVGMLAGYFLYRTDCKLQIHKAVNLLLWAMATGSALAVLYGLYGASNGHPITLSVSAFYNAVNRQVWAACVCWVIIACVTGNGGFVNTILSWPALVPLSRLTYTIYLLHIMLIGLYISNRNTIFYMDDINLVMLFLGILVVSYMASVVVSLAFEAPMMALEKIIFHPAPRDDSKVNNEEDRTSKA